MTDSLLEDKVLEDIIRELGVEDVSPEVKQAMVVALGEQIYTATMIEVFEILPKPKHEEFRSMIGKASPLKLHNFLEPYIDLAALVQRVAARQSAIMKGRLADV